MTMQAVPALPAAALAALPAALTELQGLTFSLLAGAAANTAIALAAITPEDTVLFAMNNNAGTLTDITNTITIVNPHASGTVTAASVVAGDTVTVDGRVYTAVANGTAPVGNQFSVGASDAACAANLAAAINAGETLDASSKVTATAASAVVTITARAAGTGGNAITLATSNNTRLAKSGTTLANGAASGNIKSSGTTNQILLVWLNKR
jgi:phage tail sheath gpL-like